MPEYTVFKKRIFKETKKSGKNFQFKKKETTETNNPDLHIFFKK